jgi:hypothetical protein
MQFAPGLELTLGEHASPRAAYAPSPGKEVIDYAAISDAWLVSGSDRRGGPGLLERS